MVAMLARASTSEEEDGEAAVMAVEEIRTAVRRRHNTVGKF